MPQHALLCMVSPLQHYSFLLLSGTLRHLNGIRQVRAKVLIMWYCCIEIFMKCQPGLFWKFISICMSRLKACIVLQGLNIASDLLLLLWKPWWPYSNWLVHTSWQVFISTSNQAQNTGPLSMQTRAHHIWWSQFPTILNSSFLGVTFRVKPVLTGYSNSYLFSDLCSWHTSIPLF